MKLIFATLFTILIVPAGIATYVVATGSHEETLPRKPQNIEKNAKLKDSSRDEDYSFGQEPI